MLYSTRIPLLPVELLFLLLPTQVLFLMHQVYLVLLLEKPTHFVEVPCIMDLKERNRYSSNGEILLIIHYLALQALLHQCSLSEICLQVELSKQSILQRQMLLSDLKTHQVQPEHLLDSPEIANPGQL